MAAAADTDARATGASEEHPLRRTWVLWELREKLEGERYRDTLIQLFEFSTAEEFWRKWLHAPRILCVPALAPPQGWGLPRSAREALAGTGRVPGTACGRRAGRRNRDERARAIG